MSNSSENITNAKVWSLAWPVIVSNVSIPMLEATNTGIMGHLESPKYLAALALAIMLVQYIYVSFNFLRMGTTGITSQAYGKDSGKEVAFCFFRSVAIAVLFGLLITLVQQPISVIAFKIFQGTEVVESLANQYFQIRILGATATLCNFVSIGWLLGIQRPKSALFVQILMNGLNVILALLFVLKMGMGIQGAAYATLISEITAFLVGFGIVLNTIINKYEISIREIDFKELFDLSKVLEIFKLNGNIFIRSILLITAFAWFTNTGAKQGEVVLASNEILILLSLFLAFALDGFAQAAEVLVGKSIGAKNKITYMESVRLTTVWAAIFAVLFSLTYLLFGKLIVDTLTDIESVREVAKTYLPWMIVMPLIGIWCYQLDGIFIGATQTKDMRNMMLIAFFIYGVSIITIVPVMGNHGLWLSLMIFLAARAATLFVRLPAIQKRFNA